MGLTKEQLEFRRSGITATDIVVLSGESPYGDTQYDVWGEKCLPDPAPRASTERMEWGNKIEPLIVADVARKNNVCLMYPCHTMRSTECDWAMATLDARIVDAPTPAWNGYSYDYGVFRNHPQTIQVLECKVVGHRKAHTWAEPEEGAMPPDWVVVQATWQMFVSGVHKAMVAALLGTELRTYDVPYDEELAEGLKEIGGKFWRDHVVTKIPPKADGSESSREMLAKIWPKNRIGMIPATTRSDELANLYFDAKENANVWLAKAGQYAAELQEIVKDNEGIDGQNWRLFWRHREPAKIEAYTRSGYRHFDIRRKGQR